MDDWLLFCEGIIELKQRSAEHNWEREKNKTTFIQSVHVLLNRGELVNSKKKEKKNSYSE